MVHDVMQGRLMIRPRAAMRFRVMKFTRYNDSYLVSNGIGMERYEHC